MGLTVHADIRCRVSKKISALDRVKQMRSLAMDLPFQDVTKIISLKGKACDWRSYPKRGEDPKFDIALSGHTSVRCPWNDNYRYEVCAEEIHAFHVVVGPGSEWLTLGLSKYPATVKKEYSPRDDQKFLDNNDRGTLGATFNWRRWQRYLEKKQLDKWLSADDQQFKELREIKVRGASTLSFGTFCKTQYASEPACGGLPNFLRCHLLVIALLERIGQLPGISVEINDEGHYGTAYYSDDWREAYAEKREPTYAWHPATYSVKELAEQVGDYNQLVAAFHGAMSDALSGSKLSLQSPIQKFSNFEQLEFRGSQDPKLQPFLQAMESIAAANRTDGEDP